MQPYEILKKHGFRPVTYSDALFNNETIKGTVSEEKGQHGLYAAVCITIEDNGIQGDNLEAMMLKKETVKEIAYTTDILYTNFGCEVHSHTMKTVYPFNKLKIIKLQP
jgi:uncharacterized protein (DUF1697 family)